MSMLGDDGRDSESLIDVLRKTSEMAEQLLRENEAMTDQLRSLEAELASAKARVNFLEQETARLRGTSSREPSSGDLAARLRQLSDEQNVLAHMMVVTDWLGRTRSARQALDTSCEVLHNLVGATIYEIWLRRDNDDEPVAVRADGDVQRIADRHELVARCMQQGRPAQPAGVADNTPPMCAPLHLDGRIVGALLVGELVEQVQSFGPLQRDLLGLLSERLPFAMCAGALHDQADGLHEVWQQTVRHWRSE